MTEEKCQEVLCDRSASGRVRDWKLHKIHNNYIALAYESVDLGKAERMRTCADWLKFRREEGGSLKLHDARFCRVRLCPICQWRRALKTFAQMSQVLEAARQEKYTFLFLTLTMKNVSGSELSEALDTLSQGFNRLTKYKAVASVVHGYYRACEVTHNTRDDSFHPHLHVILAVKSTYFKGTSYLSQAEWTKLWARACKFDYTPIVDVRRCKGGVKAIAEACKYAVKPSDIINLDDWQMTVDTLAVLDVALASRRFIGLGGVFKDIHKQLHLDDIEDGDLVHVETVETENEVEPEVLTYFWNGYNQYVR